MRFAPIAVSALILTMQCPDPAQAWGREGHTTTGVLALMLIDDTARRNLDDILGSTDTSNVDSLCNWPDNMRELREWDWSKPLHYVNLPRSATDYDAARDCRDGVCVTEGIKKYANELGDDRLPKQQRKEAFSWLCHLVGDLHQPLHSGFADDRGGNRVEVVFDGTRMNLHHFWDRALIQNRVGSPRALSRALKKEIGPPSDRQWNPQEVNAWTVESNRIAHTMAYPAAAEIDMAFADQSWEVIRERIPLGAERLALILNAVLGDGEVVLDR